MFTMGATTLVRCEVGRIWAASRRAGSAGDGVVATIGNAIRSSSRKPAIVVSASFNAIGDVMVTLDAQGNARRLLPVPVYQNRFAASSVPRLCRVP